VGGSVSRDRRPRGWTARPLERRRKRRLGDRARV